MIREKTGRGFFRRLRRLRGLPAGALLLAGLVPGPAPLLAPLPAPSGPAPGPAWWEVRLTVAARGEFSLKGGGEPVSGAYSCRARWEGRLEPDGEDFLLVHIRTEVLEWRLEGKAGPAGGEVPLDCSGPPAPDLRLRYVLRTGREVEFDYDLSDVAVPLPPSPLEAVLELPRSPWRGPGLAGQRYGDFVRRGSSRIAVPDSDFSGRAAERSFSWDWRRVRLVKDDRPDLLIQSHSAEAVLALVAHER